MALFPQRGNNYLSTEWFENAPNRLLEVLPKAGKWANVIKVIEAAGLPETSRHIVLDADAFKQTAICYLAHA